ncbi:hypothetical protein HDU98_000599 [Podochytrium sp. JEL0797]|nr:hypothetical protein HDU98_000599 [Podochytrium sp. JEL0797]
MQLQIIALAFAASTLVMSAPIRRDDELSTVSTATTLAFPPVTATTNTDDDSDDESTSTTVFKTKIAPSAVPPIHTATTDSDDESTSTTVFKTKTVSSTVTPIHTATTDSDGDDSDDEDFTYRISASVPVLDASSGASTIALGAGLASAFALFI